jgi:hypothetical protein
VLVEAARGRLPTQLTTTGIGYEAPRGETEAVLHLQTQIDDLRWTISSLSERQERPFTGPRLESDDEVP